MYYYNQHLLHFVKFLDMSSPGVVYNYTLSGMQRDDHGWEQCISVPLVAPGEEIFGRQWDSELETFSLLPGWSPHRFYTLSSSL